MITPITPSISIIIPAYNEEKYIKSCLEHIIQNTQETPYEIIVIDNASTDNTAMIARDFPHVRVVREEKKGVNHARNRGFYEAKGDILAFVDADTRMPKTWIQKIYTVFMSDTQTTFISGPYYYYDIPLWEKCIYMFFGGIFLCGSLFLGPIGVGGNFAIRRSSLEKLDGFDTNIAFYGDDTHIAYRAQTLGKAKFIFSLMMPTSGRRLRGQGVIRTYITYLVNYLSVSIKNTPFHHEYTDYR